MDIVICTDNNYVMPSGVLFCSICENNRQEDITFHVIADQSFSDENRQALSNIVKKYEKKIYFYQIDPSIFTSFPVGRKDQPIHITLAAYYRLYLTELLPKDLNKVLYLDGDIIVRGNLKDLWETDIENYAVGVIPDQSEGLIHFYNRLKYPQRLGYFNSGVLLINLDYWRKYNLIRQFYDFLQKYPERIQLHDQDILNYVLKDQKKNLPLKYNVQNKFLYKEISISWEYEEQLEEAIKNPCIIHYLLSNKPWNKRCDHPFKNEFFKYQKLTQWKDIPLQPNKNKPTKKEIIKNILQKIGILSMPKNPYKENLKL